MKKGTKPSRNFDGWRWWRNILTANLTQITYGDSEQPIARQLATAIHENRPQLDSEILYEKCKALHEACYLDD